MAILVFFGLANLYALRVNLSVAVVCMVNHTWAAEQEEAVNSSSLSSEQTCGQKSNSTAVVCDGLKLNFPFIRVQCTVRRGTKIGEEKAEC